MYKYNSVKDIGINFQTLQKKVDCNDFSMLYPNGFFTKESVIQIVDGYVKTGLLRNSEIY